MKFICKKHKNLCIVIEPKKRVHRQDGSIEVIQGKKIRFKNGVFNTDDKDIITVLDKYSSKYGIELLKKPKSK